MRLYLLAALVAGCSPAASSSDAGSDAGVEAEVDAGYPGPHPSVPQVQNHMGMVLDSPQVIPIFFMNDSEETPLEDFMSQLAKSSFWPTATSEYGAGPLTIASSIVVTDTPPTSIDVMGIESWLGGYLDGTHAGWPTTVTPNTVFAIFYPAATTIDDPIFGTSCNAFNGFHNEGTANPNLVYIVIPRCPTAGTLTGLDGWTVSLSHEIVEAATDPLLNTTPAWAYTDAAHLIWSFEPGAEIADMCSLEPQAAQLLVGPYMVQRPWSNASASAGHDPCVPPLSQPYFNAAPVLADNVNIAFQMQYIQTTGISVPLGMSRTIPVQLFSDAPTADWSVQAIDTSQPTGLTFSWDAQTGNNGDTLHLTITRQLASSSEFVIESTSDQTTHLWFGFAAQ
jgi:hypothetical protein